MHKDDSPSRHPASKDYVALNREGWTKANERYTGPSAHDTWAQEEITWGQWAVPEREVGILPDVARKEVVELGCGTAYFGAWLKRAGASRVVGIDVTPAQLETARQLDEEFGLGLELIEANAEDVPLPDESFDLAFSEYGASIWCDPALWIAEAARLLRPQGELVFMRGTTLRILCAPDVGKTGDQLQRPQRDMYRLDWEAQDEDDWEGVEFHPPTGEMLRILRTNGFELVDFRELYAPPDAVDHPWYDDPPVEWAKQWPAEEIWRLRLRPR
jgi:ubiquinone/menaquinone biosynthesis C-methylase UbiE